ncbi:hypothetical protein [Nonomuraea sp. NPDC049758]|uniref:hypothetical protein n=1 Tax=Nonomuraea sp. NPDC049758 TaxID=3154360 RepID=UPI003428B5A7
MVQLRLMGDDADRVREVAALVLAALRGHPALQLGDAAELTNRRGPGVRVVFDVSTAIAAGPRTPAAADLCPETGRGRLSYPRAEYLFKTASARLDPDGEGWTLHQLRHSALQRPLRSRAMPVVCRPQGRWLTWDDDDQHE